MGTGHFSSASGRMVWFVYPNVSVQIAQASSQPRNSSSNNRRMSSGMATLGCVSLSWIATFFENCRSVRPGASRFLYRRRASCRVALTKKNCCFKRNTLPLSLSSEGYSTLVMLSHRSFASTAP